MNKEINQICQRINCQDILNKKFYPVWFFTNERISSFFQKLENHREIKKVFSIGGGGDFVFSLLSSFSEIKEVNLCDTRQMANISIDFKIALLKNLEYVEILDLFLKRTIFCKEIICKRIKETMSLLSREVIDFVVENSKEENFLKCLRKSGLWYRDSFWQTKNRKEYLPYLISKEKYQLLQNNLDKISIYCGDFDDNLKLFQNNYYDLVYLSNILESKKYCQTPDFYLQTIKDKLKQGGLMVLTTQNNPKKIIKLANKAEFSIIEKEVNKFKVIPSLFGHYSYSFLLFTKN